jgi:ribosomal protein S18 acetylase RimI-like enzyme
MPRREVTVLGPERATLRDIEALNQLFSEAFTERYHRDGMTGVRVPFLSPEVWHYAIEDAGDGAMLWRDPDGVVAAFNMVHRSGAEGWMGPLAVHPGLQGRGVGQRVVRAGIEWLQDRGSVRCIGLETMPRTIENIGFYSRIGFRPGHLTITMVLEVPATSSGPAGERLSAGGANRARWIAECRALTDRLAPGVDYTREVELTADLEAGDTTLVRRHGHLAGFAIWHAVPLALGRSTDETRVLKVVAADLEAFRALVGALCREAASAGRSRLTVRCQGEYPEAYAVLVEEGFRVYWTDLRMTLGGVGGGAGGIVLSNWEI